jgi:hypothetical protein
MRKALEGVAGFIDQALEPGFETFGEEHGVDLLVGREDVGAEARFERLSMDEV